MTLDQYDDHNILAASYLLESSHTFVSEVGADKKIVVKMTNIVSAQILLQITLYFSGYYLVILYLGEVALLCYKGERKFDVSGH